LQKVAWDSDAESAGMAQMAVTGSPPSAPGVERAPVVLLDCVQVADAFAQQFDLPLTTLLEKIPQDVLDEIPAAVAREHRVLPLGYRNEQLRVAMSSPTNAETLQLLQFLTGRSLQIEVAAEDVLLRKIDACYEILDENEDFAALEASAQRTGAATERNELQALAAAKPVVRLLNSIVLEAIRHNASDIHIRPGEKDVELIFRIDGDLIPIRRFARALLPAIVGRIKILGVMDITEHRVPQDGQMRIQSGNRAIDIRISVMPSVQGESVVMRVLLARIGKSDITEIGLSPNDTQRLKDALDRSHGMMLVTGPTGSGKSTTLYAAINAVIRQNVNIITVENPVEFHIPGITQIPINADIGMTFARALRNILRHDPDVIMIGEIRDTETARIAVESAQTGHLVLSTLHTNSATAAVARLVEMGVESYLLKATLLGVLAQRLVRRSCPDCRAVEDVDVHVRELMGVTENETFLRGIGCATCAGTGTRGRCMTYEYMVATPALRKLILPGVDESVLQEQALRDGMVPLTQHAIGLARSHEISLQEAYMTRLE
jgi:type IV pilus assembly protein PilB